MGTNEINHDEVSKNRRYCCVDLGDVTVSLVMRIATIADTHGNLIALEAVLNDLRTQAPDLVVNLGDLFTGRFDPAGSPDMQIARGCPTLAGNHERNLLEGDDTSTSSRLRGRGYQQRTSPG